MLRIGDVSISFHPAGHVLGSAQIRIENNRIVGISYLTHESWLEELLYEGSERIPRYRRELIAKSSDASLESGGNR